MPLVRNLYPNSGKPGKRVEILDAACRKSLPKQRKSRKKGREPQTSLSEISTQTVEISRKGRDSQCPPAAYLYPNSGNQPKRVEIPRATGRISLPKQRKSAENVEIPSVPVRISLPKQQKSADVCVSVQ